MQLFELAKAHAKNIDSTVTRLFKENGEQRVFNNLSFSLGGFVVTDPENEKPAPVRESATHLELEVRHARGKKMDIALIHSGITEFVGSALNFALNPTVLQQNVDKASDLAIAIMHDTEEKGALRVYFPRLDKTTFNMRKLCDNLDRLETMMFSGWRPRQPKSAELVKTFATREECERTAHLLQTMANAIGIPEETAQSAFRPAPNDHSLVINEKFLTVLADAERTMEADFGRRRA